MACSECRYLKGQTHREVGPESHGSRAEIAGLPQKGSPFFLGGVSQYLMIGEKGRMS